MFLMVSIPFEHQNAIRPNTFHVPANQPSFRIQDTPFTLKTSLPPLLDLRLIMHLSFFAIRTVTPRRSLVKRASGCTFSSPQPSNRAILTCYFHRNENLRTRLAYFNQFPGGVMQASPLFDYC